MEEEKTGICRICLSFSKKYDVVDGDQEDMLQIVVPDMDLKICRESYICYDCCCALQETFSFKSTCLEIEDTIHSYTNNGQIQINLDKITGLKDLEINDMIEKYSKICRTCLNVTEPLSYIKLDNNNAFMELEMMQYYLPEVDITLTNDPIMCEKCQRLLKKYSNFHKTVMKNENRIKSYLQNTSKCFGRNFELTNLFENHIENQSKILHEELNIEDEEIETKPEVDNMKSLEVESQVIKDRNLENLTNDISKDKLLSELDTAIMSCEDNIAQNKFQSVEISRDELDKMIEEVSDSSDGPPIVKKPYNTRNKRKKIIIEPVEDNIEDDPDFPEPFDDDSDDDYTEGFEEFRRLSRNRKTPKESNLKPAEKLPCKFCHKLVYSVALIPHLNMCSRNPQNNFSVECVHCGVRMNSMQKLQQHTVYCKKYIEWKSKNDSLGTNLTNWKDNLESLPLVSNVDQNIRQQSNHSDIQEGFSSNQNNDEDINPSPISGIGKILSCTTLAHSNEDSNMDQEKNVDSQNITNASIPKTVTCSKMSDEVQTEQNVGVIPERNYQSNQEDLRASTSSILTAEKIHHDTIFITPITVQENQPDRDRVKNTDMVEDLELNNPSKENTITTIKDQMSNQISNSEEVSKPTSMQLDDENGAVTSSTDNEKSMNKLTDTSTNEIVESTLEDADVIFISETANTGQVSVRKEIADSSNDNLPFPKISSSDITMTDYMKSELLRLSVTHIDQLSSQFLGVLKCNKCNYNTRDLANIDNHVVSHFSEPKENENYLCVLCHKLENGLYVFLNHMKSVHKHVFFTPFYWCVKCATIFKDIKYIHSHNCPKNTYKVKMFKSNGVIFCMMCEFETVNMDEGKLHAKLCEKKRLSNLQPTEFIEIDDDDDD